MASTTTTTAGSSSTNPFNNAIELEDIVHFQKVSRTHPPFSHLTRVHELGQVKTNGNGPSSSNPFGYPEDSDSSASSDHEEEEEDRHRTFETEIPAPTREFCGDSIRSEDLFPPNGFTDQVTKCDFLFCIIVFLVNVSSFVSDFWVGVWHYRDGLMWSSGLTFLFMGTGGFGMLVQFGKVDPNYLQRLFPKPKRLQILVNCFPPLATILVSFESLFSAYASLSTNPMQSQQHFRVQEFSHALSRVQSFFQSAPQGILQLVILLYGWEWISSDKIIFTLVNIVISLSIMTNANLPSKGQADGGKAAYLPKTRIFVGLRMFCSLGSRCMAVSFLIVGTICLFNNVNHTFLAFSQELEHLAQTNCSGNCSSGSLDDKHNSTFSEDLTVEDQPVRLFIPIILSLILLIFPRILFTLVDQVNMSRTVQNNLATYYSDSPEIGVSSSRPHRREPMKSTLLGYLATIFFPVGDPFWLFWYLWCESGLFMLYGNVVTLEHPKQLRGCMDRWVKFVYTIVFAVSFVIVPIVIPAAKSMIVSKRRANMMRQMQT